MLLTFLAVTAVGLLRMRSLFALVMLTGFYSLLSAALFVVLDAVDVAFTEASVGAGIATVLMVGTLGRIRAKDYTSHDRAPMALLVVILTGAALIYGTLDMPHYGDPDAPAHRHVAPEYVKESGTAIGIPNVVTSVLASYRGYDTLGEVTVIFTAGIAVMGLLVAGRRRKDHRVDTDESGGDG